MKRTKKPREKQPEQPKPQTYLEPALVWTEFSDNVIGRMSIGRQEYGNAVFLKPIVDNLRESAEEYLDSCGWKVIALCQMEGNPDPVEIWNKVSKVVRCRLQGKDPTGDDMIAVAPDLETEIAASIVQDCIQALILYCRTMRMIKALEHRDEDCAELSRTYTVKCKKFPGLAAQESPRQTGRVTPGMYGDKT